MIPGLFDQIRSAGAAVAERARHVRIARDRIDAYASSLPLKQATLPEHDPVAHYLDHGHDSVAFFVTLDAINFGSGYFPHLHKRAGMSGYFTIAASLTDHYRTNGPISSEHLARIAKDECTTIFGQDPSNEVVQELMQLFATALNDLGTYVLSRFDGSFLKLVQSAGNSAERLAQLLSEMRYFKDVEQYGGLDVPFYKRAQLTAADLSLAFGGRSHGRFDDLDTLTIFADNLVPHVLRMDGLLEYDRNLAEKIDTEHLIPAGSEEEVEIRACAVHTVELIKQELQRNGNDVTSMGLDYLLWNRGQQSLYKLGKPRHRTRTVFY